MSEDKQVKKQLIKNMFLNLITFTIIFTILGTIIYGQFRSSLYISSDEELAKSSRVKEFEDRKGPIPSADERFIEQPTVNMEVIENNENKIVEMKTRDRDEFESPRLIKIIRDTNGTVLQNISGFNDNFSEFFENVEFDENTLNTIYEVDVQGYSYRAINYQNDDGSYTQALINVNSEKDIADQFIRNLVISFSISVVVIVIASYILSKRTMKPIVESWKKQTQFVQDASHELRTPLTIIKAKQESLLEKPESTIIDNVEDISITLQETQRLTKLIKELMELAKSDSDRLVMNKETFKLDDELKSIINLYKDVAQADQKQMKLNLNYNNVISADSNKLKELMVILLDNSLKYTETGDSIEVKTYKENNRCVIEVIDTGIGISKEAIDHIFERFYREEKSRTREKGGMGLGLSIAYSIVQLHKGSIKYDKNINKGTRVIVKLPIK